MEINCPYCHAPQDIEIQAIVNGYACGECGKTYKVFIAVTTDGAKPIKNTMQQEPQQSALAYLVNALTYKDPKTGNYHSAVGENSNVTHIVEKAMQQGTEFLQNIFMHMVENEARQEPKTSALAYLVNALTYDTIPCKNYFTALNADTDVTRLIENAIRRDAERIATSLHEIMAAVKEAANIGQIGSDNLERKIKDILYR